MWAKLRAAMSSPAFWVRMHLGLTVTWLALLPPSILFWQQSIPYLVFMSAWANVAGSAASLQAARADCNSPTVEDLQRIDAKLDLLLTRVAIVVTKA